MSTTPVIAILATLDTKAQEASFVADRVRASGGDPLIVDIGVVGEGGCPADLDRSTVARAGGRELSSLLASPTRQEASPVMIAGASSLLATRLAQGGLHGAIGMGGTQGTPNCCAIMRSLPYGMPKIMVSTIASGDVGPFVDIKDITMMFSVGDILGLNPLLRSVLSNAAAAAVGMAQVAGPIVSGEGQRPLIGVTNLGVLTEGTMHAVERFRARGWETIVFHAVGSGGRAMEQLMREGVIGGVFDYALGEISDECFGGLRAGDEHRLTVAAELGLPQVLCPGGSEHIGLMVEPDTVPDAWTDHLHVFHNPVIFAPRLSQEQLRTVAQTIGARLQGVRGSAVMMLPRKGVSRYSVAGGPLHDPFSEAAYLDAIADAMPPTVQVEQHDAEAEDSCFVDACVDRLIGLIEEAAGAHE
ncbi:MAG: Tm-1-like ATP-binding domain-containing protein [Phycisphaerales bacterium]|nr:Tm-1-like ATP-binding domain-containing protein [Phycisphaerales bacterium]